MRLGLRRLVNKRSLPQASTVMLEFTTIIYLLCFSQLLSLKETDLPCRGIARVKVLTSNCCDDEGSVSAHIKIVDVLGLQFIQQLMKSYISLHRNRVELFNAIAHY